MLLSMTITMVPRNNQTALMAKARASATFNPYKLSCIIYGGYAVLYLLITGIN